MATTRPKVAMPFVAVLALYSFASAMGPHARAAVPAVTVEEIAKVWKDRESRTQSFAFEWTVTEFVPKGTRNFDRLRYNPKMLIPVVYPPNDTTFDFERQLKIDGGKLRYESQGPNLVQELGEYLPRLFVSVNDSANCKTVYYGNQSDEKQFHTHGFVTDPVVDLTAREIELLPIQLCYRPFASCLDDSGLSEYSVSPIMATDPAGECLVLTRAQQGGVETILWIAPQHEYLPVRWQTTFRGQMMHQICFSYKREGAERSVPSGWVRTSFALATPEETVGALTSKSTAHVAAHVLNESMPDSTFDVEFPVGAWVTDALTGEDYILREGGRKRLITKEEMAAGYSYETYFNTESGMAGQTEGAEGRRAWLVGGVMAVILASLGVLVARRVRQLRHRSV